MLHHHWGRCLLPPPPGGELVYASVNDYSIAFDPCNQGDFRHLVTVNIPRGNPAIFSLIKCISLVVGSYVKGFLGTDLRHISVIVESKLKLFPAHGLFQLQDSEVTKVFFEYEGRNLRCCYCFSYRHFPSQCKEPRPAFFNSPALWLDSIQVLSGGPAQPRAGTSAAAQDNRPAAVGVTGKDRVVRLEHSSGARKTKSKRGRSREKPHVVGEVPASSSGAAAAPASIDGTPSRPTTLVGTPGFFPQLTPIVEGPCYTAPVKEFDTVMQSAHSPDKEVPTVVIAPAEAIRLPDRENFYATTNLDIGGKSGHTPSQPLSFDKVTTRKRDRGDAHDESGLF